MIDMESVKQIVQEFAEKYNFIQKTDMERVEKMADFDSFMNGCYKLQGKKYVCIAEWQDRTEIQLGTLFIHVDKDDEGDEEYYSIDQERTVSINVADFSDADVLMKTLEENVKNINKSKMNKSKMDL